MTDYPHEAGFKEPGATSQDVAEAIERAGRAATLRRKVLAYFEVFTGTADEAAAALGESILAIRPRCSELRGQGLIEPTGARRRSAGGRQAHVMRLVQRQRELPL